MEAIKKYMSEYHLRAILEDCEKYNMSLDDYLVTYILSTHGMEFWDYVDSLMNEQLFGSNEEIDLDEYAKYYE